MNSGIPFQSYAFHISPVEPILLPSYKGSTLRGGFGHAFRKVVCAIRNQECSNCLLSEKCVYSYIFETPPPVGTKIMRKYKSAPHPFIIEPPSERKQGYTPGSEIVFGLTLIGRAVDYLPYFIYSFDELGNMGIGRGRGRYILKKVKSKNRIIYDSKSKTLKTCTNDILSLNSSSKSKVTLDPKPITLDFITPTRIVYNGSLTVDLEFHILIRNLLRRLSLLYYFHCDGDPSGWDFKGIIKKAQNIKVKKKSLKWYDWERYSARQDEKLKMGGFIGDIIFEGDVEPFIPIIKAGEVLHVGKGTGFGLGKYKLITLSNPP